MINEANINSISTSSADNNTNINKENKILIDIDDENVNNLLLDSNKIKTKNNNKQSKKSEIFVSIIPEIPKKSENRIICFARRRKMPKDIESLTGYLITLSLFIIFTILMSICLSSAKNKPDISDSILKTIYNLIIYFIWITTIISIICLSDAAWADPGRQRGTPISKNIYDISKIKKIIGGKKYSLKYCTTCHLIRDIRTFHCKICGVCIEKHDHHCSYLSNCVGVYNYKKFFLFVIIACIHVNIIFFTSVHYIFFCQGNDENDRDFEWITILMTIITVFGLFFEVFTVWMVIQHITIIVQNRTTREFIKLKEYGIYNKGCRENCKEALCSNEIKEL